MKKSITRHAILIVLLCITAWLMFGCRSIQYVPVETVKVEYRDKLKIDSIIKYDSIFYDRYMKGDTVFMTKEKYRYLDKIKIVRDSVFKTDSIQIPYPVKVEKEVNRLSSFQSFQIWCGRILLLLLGLWFGYKFFIKKFL